MKKKRFKRDLKPDSSGVNWRGTCRGSVEPRQKKVNNDFCHMVKVF